MSKAKQAAALAALAYVRDGQILGVGTGSTTQYFIEGLAAYKHKIEGVVASSVATAKSLKALGLPLLEFNEVSKIDLYVDGADEINEHKQMIKGGGGAMTREKILATCSEQFICIADPSKYVKLLGKFPIAVEVIPMARSFVARALVKLGAFPEYRVGFVTDNGNVIIDCYQLDCTDLLSLEQTLKALPGVVDSGVFAKRRADIWLSGC